MRLYLVLVLIMSPMVLSRSKPYIRRAKNISDETKPDSPIILSEGWVKQPVKAVQDETPEPALENASHEQSDDVGIEEIPMNGNKTHLDNLQIGAQVVADMKAVVGIIVHVTEQVVNIINRNNTIPYLKEACKLRVSDQNNQHVKESPVNCVTMDNFIRKVENEPVIQDLAIKNPLKYIVPININCMFVRVLADSSVLEKKVDCSSLQAHTLGH